MRVIKKIVPPTAMAVTIAVLPFAGPVLPAEAADHQSQLSSNRINDESSHSIESLRLSRGDYLELESLARQDGEEDIANLFARRANGIHERGWLGWGRKAAVWVLRHAADKVPARIRPYAGKIADFLDATEAWEVSTIATGLISQGVPPDVAWESAKWIVFAFG